MDKDKVRNAIKQYMEERNITKAQMARELGISRPLLVQWLNGEDSEYAYEAAKKWYERRGSGFIWSFVATNAVKRAWGLIESAYEDSEIAVIVGNAGVGKTTILKEYNRRNPDRSVYLAVDVAFTARELLIEIGRELGLVLSGTTRSMLRMIEKALMDERRVLLIDEADLLTVRHLELLRAIHDATGCGMVLAGLPRLLVILKRGPDLRENLAQLYSRVGFVIEMQMPSDEDIKLFVESVGVELRDGGFEELKKVGMSNGLRGIAKVLRNAVKAVGSKRIDGAAIRGVKRFMIVRV